MKIIPYGRQYIDNQDIKLVSKVLKQDLITTGKYVKKFERNISKYLKEKITSKDLAQKMLSLRDAVLRIEESNK